MPNSNIETTKLLYQAFGAGNIPAILERLASDVQWEYGPLSHDIPWYKNRVGVEQAAEFFAALAATEFTQFEPTAFIGEGDTVVVLLNAKYIIRATKQEVVYEDAVMLWRYNAEGKVAKFAHRVDTHQAWLAFHGKKA